MQYNELLDQVKAFGGIFLFDFVNPARQDTPILSIGKGLLNLIELDFCRLLPNKGRGAYAGAAAIGSKGHETSGCAAVGNGNAQLLQQCVKRGAECGRDRLRWFRWAAT